MIFVFAFCLDLDRPLPRRTADDWTSQLYLQHCVQAHVMYLEVVAGSAEVEVVLDDFGLSGYDLICYPCVLSPRMCGVGRGRSLMRIHCLLLCMCSPLRFLACVEAEVLDTRDCSKDELVCYGDSRCSGCWTAVGSEAGGNDLQLVSDSPGEVAASA